jgi:3-oxoacyl-[acyl-carrier protein] reductase
MRHGAPTATVYGASKGALDSFTRGAAKELAPDIRVNAVAPGVILTPFHEKYTSPEQMERFRDMNPLKSHGSSDQIAKTIRFIIENGFLTGETIDVNGGVFMR